MRRIDLSSASASSTASTPRPNTPSFSSVLSPLCGSEAAHSPAAAMRGCADGTFATGIVVDAAERIAAFLGPSPSALALSLTNFAWARHIRTHGQWEVILRDVAPYSTHEVRRMYHEARQAGRYSAQVDWVALLAVAWRNQLTLQTTTTDPQQVAVGHHRSNSGSSATSNWLSFRWVIRSLPFGRQPRKYVVITGSAAGGKRTFVSRLENVDGREPVGIGTGFFRWSNWDVALVGLVGARRILPLLSHYFDEAGAIIVVLDASDAVALDQFRTFLEWVLERNRGACPICFVVNKLDLPGALSCEGTLSRLKLDQFGPRLFRKQGLGSAPSPGAAASVSSGIVQRLSPASLMRLNSARSIGSSTGSPTTAGGGPAHSFFGGFSSSPPAVTTGGIHPPSHHHRRRFSSSSFGGGRNSPLTFGSATPPLALRGLQQPTGSGEVDGGTSGAVSRANSGAAPAGGAGLTTNSNSNGGGGNGGSSSSGGNERPVAAIGTCLAHSVVGKNTAAAVFGWLDQQTSGKS